MINAAWALLPVESAVSERSQSVCRSSPHVYKHVFPRGQLHACSVIVRTQAQLVQAEQQVGEAVRHALAACTARQRQTPARR